jgi:peptidoglycan/LPS O-acetylase OafA/YrhL
MNTPFGGIVGQFPLRLDTMMVGVAMAYIKLNHKKVFVFLSKPISFIIAILIFHIYVFYWGQATSINSLDDSLWYRTGHFVTLSIFIGLLLPFLDSNIFLNQLTPKNIFRKLITWISLISYSLYLTHTDIAILVQQSTLLREYNLNNYLFAMLLALGFSSLLYLYFERPLLKLRDKKNTP